MKKPINDFSILSEDQWKNLKPFHDNKNKKKLFLLYLLQNKLYFITNTNGYQINTKLIQKHTGIGRDTIGIYLKQMIKLKWIKLINKKYKVGARSRTWKIVSPELWDIHGIIMQSKLTKTQFNVNRQVVERAKVERIRLNSWKVFNFNQFGRYSNDEIKKKVQQVVWAYKGMEYELVGDYRNLMSKITLDDVNRYRLTKTFMIFSRAWRSMASKTFVKNDKMTQTEWLDAACLGYTERKEHKTEVIKRLIKVRERRFVLKYDYRWIHKIRKQDKQVRIESKILTYIKKAFDDANCIMQGVSRPKIMKLKEKLCFRFWNKVVNSNYLFGSEVSKITQAVNLSEFNNLLVV